MTLRITAPLQIICAAIRTECGQIIRGHRHSDCLDACRKRRLMVVPGAAGQGFIASDGHYYGRKAAYRIQKLAGIQSHDPGGYRGRELYSEDLY